MPVRFEQDQDPIFSMAFQLKINQKKMKRNAEILVSNSSARCSKQINENTPVYSFQIRLIYKRIRIVYLVLNLH